jgi:predicted hotdog family 3-hydroxylacyl-ACP dehydratase
MTTPTTFRITDVLPQQGAMLLLDEVLEHGAEHVVCGVTLHERSQFCDGARGVPAWVGLEYMAQTMCAYSGVEEARAGLRPSIGLLLGARRYQAHVDYFPVGARLRIRADLVLRDENDLVAFDCTIHHGEALLARGDVKALRPKDVMAVIRGGRGQ